MNAFFKEFAMQKVRRAVFLLYLQCKKREKMFFIQFAVQIGEKIYIHTICIANALKKQFLCVFAMQMKRKALLWLNLQQGKTIFPNRYKISKK